jgi:hypothetical protein
MLDDGNAKAFPAPAEERTPAEDEALGRGDAAEWAGVYTTGGIFGATTIELRPGAGFELHDRHVGPNWDGAATGGLEFLGDRVRLPLEGGNAPEVFRRIGPELLLVRWGPRHYLVAATRVVDFCNAVNSGSEPRSEICCGAFLKLGEETWPAPGWPELPPADFELLLSRPVSATVLSVGAAEPDAGAEDAYLRKTPLTIDAGRFDGLRVGMGLYVAVPDVFMEWMELTNVDEHRSEGVLHQIVSSSLAPLVPQAGWCLCARPPWCPLPMEPAPPAR